MYSELYPCYKCLCTKDFDNSTLIDNPNCKTIICAISTKIDKIRKGCAPIYFSTDVCCPFQWRCRKYFIYDFFFF